LSDSEVVRILQDSFTYAKEDVQARKLSEQRVEAKRMQENLLSALQADSALLTEEERSSLLRLLDELAQQENSHDGRSIAEVVERAGRESEFFAARRMNAAVQKALAGKSIQELSAADDSNGV
jgi:molecular chaperone HscA